MAEPHRSVSHSEFDVFVALDIPDVTTSSTRNKCWRGDRILIVTLGICVATARDKLMCKALQLTASEPSEL